MEEKGNDLENWIHRLDRDSSSGLRHRKHINDSHWKQIRVECVHGVISELLFFSLTCVFVHKLSQHQTHHLHGNSSPPVLQHFQQGQGGDVDLDFHLKLQLKVYHGAKAPVQLCQQLGHLQAAEPHPYLPDQHQRAAKAGPLWFF